MCSSNLQPPSAVLSDDECQRLVRVYREVNDKVIELWGECDIALGNMASWDKDMAPYYLGQGKCLEVSGSGIKLPNGLSISYPNLRWDTSESKGKYVYKSRRGEVSIWGGSVVENVVQALARIVVGEQMLKINERYRPVLTVHDAVVCVVPKEEADEAQKFIMDIMSTPPSWATDIPIACESKYGESYGDC